MALTVSDIKFFKSNNVLETDENGGTSNLAAEVVSGVKYNLFPRVSYQERLNGITRYRKEFIHNVNDSEDGYGAMMALMIPSNGGDRFYITSGALDDTQADLGSENWYGGGPIYNGITSGDTTISIQFESNDYYIGEGALICIQDDTNISWVTTSYNNRSENIATGDGSTTIYSHTVANTPVREKSVELTYTISASAETATDDGDGNITGVGISTGTIDYATGDISLDFSTAPDNATSIDVTYNDRCDTWAGNVASITLQEQVPYDFNVGETNAGVCVNLGDLISSVSAPVVTTVSGTFSADDGGGTEYLYTSNSGTEVDTFTITFTDATNFTVAGDRLGALTNGSTGSTYAPLNPNTGTPYFTININAWGGTWANGETVVFTTTPAEKAIWWKEVVPAGTSREPQNIVTAEWFVE